MGRSFSSKTRLKSQRCEKCREVWYKCWNQSGSILVSSIPVPSRLYMGSFRTARSPRLILNLFLILRGTRTETTCSHGPLTILSCVDPYECWCIGSSSHWVVPGQDLFAKLLYSGQIFRNTSRCSSGGTSTPASGWGGASSSDFLSCGNVVCAQQELSKSGMVIVRGGRRQSRSSVRIPVPRLA